MKAILFSADFVGIDATKELERLVGKPAGEIDFAVINEAAKVVNVDTKIEINDNSFFVDGMHFIKHHFGNFDLVDLLALTSEQVEERLAKADVIFVFGGNTEYLQYSFEKTGFAGILRNALREKVYCGSSAGSMVLGRMIPYELQRGLEGEDWDTYGVDEYLGVVDFSILPHLGGGNLMDDERGRKVLEVSKSVDWDIYALSDRSAVVVDGGEVRVIGECWAKVREGEIVEQDVGEE